MRVCLDARKLWDSGIGTYIRGLLGGFSEIGEGLEWDFIVRPDDITSHALKRVSGQFHKSSAGNYSISELFGISRLANITSSDLFHAPHYVVPFGLKLPLVVTVHDLIHLKFPQYFPAHKRAYARWMLRRVGKKAQSILAVSENTKRDLESELGLDQSKILVCYNGVDKRFFQPVSEEQKSRFLREYVLPNDYLLYVGNLKPHKNVSGLIEAWATLPNSIRPALVLVGGLSDLYPLLKRRVMELNLDGEVFFPGWLSEDEMLKIYQCASAYVQPSWYEGFGLPVVEAMASGIPVAVSNRGSLPEIAGDAALVFDPDDSEQFVHVLEKIITDRNARQSLVEKGRQRAAEFSWARTARLTFDAYRMAVEAG